MTAPTPAAAEMEKWLRIRVRFFTNFWLRVRQFFKFENPTPVQTLATIIDPTVICPCFYLGDDHTDSCYCRNWKVTLDPGLFLHKFFTLEAKAAGPDPVSSEISDLITPCQLFCFSE